MWFRRRGHRHRAAPIEHCCAALSNRAGKQTDRTASRRTADGGGRADLSRRASSKRGWLTRHHPACWGAPHEPLDSPTLRSSSVRNSSTRRPAKPDLYRGLVPSRGSIGSGWLAKHSSANSPAQTAPRCTALYGPRSTAPILPCASSTAHHRHAGMRARGHAGLWGMGKNAGEHIPVSHIWLQPAQLGRFEIHTRQASEG